MGFLALPVLLLAASVPAFPANALSISARSSFASVALDEADDQYQFLAGLCEKGMHELAVKEARAFLERYPRHSKEALARYRLASSLFELKRTAEAASEFETLAKRRGFEFEAEVLFRLGQCQLALEKPAEAAASLERVLALDKPYLALAARFFLAEAKFQQGAFEEAERQYTSVLAAEGGGEYTHDASYALAWCAFRLGRHDQAIERIESFLEAHRGDPAAGELRFLMGEAQLASGRAELALAAYRAVPEGPHSDAALRGAGFALSSLERHREAAEQFAALLQRFPKSRHASEAALHCGIERLKAGDASAALAALSAREVGASPEALYWRARAELATKDAKAALATIERALAAKPPGELAERLHVARGDALSDLGRGAEAVRSYERSGSDYALYAAAVAALNDGRADEAARIASSLLAAHPKSGYRLEMQLVVGEGELAAKKYAEAERSFRAVLDAGAAGELVPRALSRVAWCRFLQNDAAAAAELFQQLVEKHAEAPEAEEGWFMLGRCRDAGGDPKGAAEAWQRYLAKYPQGARRGEALLALARLDPSERGATHLEALLRDAPEGPLAPQALFQLAERHARAQRCDEAIERYRQVLERFAQHELAPAARYGLAWCLYDGEHFAEAANELTLLRRGGPLPKDLERSALELAVWAASKSGDPNAVMSTSRELVRRLDDEARALGAVKVASSSLQKSGKLEEARALLEEFIETLDTPEVAAQALVEATWIALEQKLVDEAEASVRAALQLAPEKEQAAVAEAAFFVGEARFAADENPQAIELYRLAAAKGAGEIGARALYKQGFALLRTSKLDDAARAFAALVEQHPDSELFGESLFLLGEAHFRAGRFEEAAQALARFQKEAPKHESQPKGLFRLGLAQGRLGHWRECEAALAELAKRAPEFENAAEAELWRGRAQAAQKNARAARAAFERVVARDRGVLAAQARLELGNLSADAGDHETALSEFLKVAVLYAHEDEVSEALFRAGECLEKLGDRERARAQYRELIEKHPRSKRVPDARARLAQLGEE